MSKRWNIPRPKPERVREARCAIHAAAAEWSDFDVVRLATLIKLGKPSTVVYSVPAESAIETGAGANAIALRPANEETRAAVLNAYRRVSQDCGWPLASPHALKDNDEPQEPS